MFLNLEQSSVMEKMPPPDSLRGTPTVGQYRNDDDDDVCVKSQSLPKKVEGINGKRIEMISAGGNHSLLLANGELWSFGYGKYGRLEP